MSTETSQKPSLSQSQLDFLAKFGSMPRLGSDSNVIPPTKAPNVRVQAQPIIDNKPSNDDAYFLAPPDPVGIEATKVITTLPPKNVQNTVPPKEVPLVNVEKSLDVKSDSPRKEITNRTLFPPSVTSLLKDYISSVKDNYDLYTDDQFVQFVEEAGGAKQFSLTEDIDCDVPEKYYKAFIMRVRDTIENYASARYHRIVSPKIKETEKAAAKEQLAEVFAPIQPLKLLVTTPEAIAVQRTIRHRDLSMAKMEQALSGYHQDMADAMLFVEWSPYIDYCGIMKDHAAPFYYEYDYEENIWKTVMREKLEREGFSDYIQRLENSRLALGEAIHNSDNEAFKGNAEITMKKITTLIGKLKTTSFINAVWKRIDVGITQNILYKPYHRDLATLEDLNKYNVFPGFKARKVDLTTMDPRLYRILQHIYIVWANRNDSLYSYLLSWLAFPFRNLERTNVCLVLIGDPGCGKSMIFEFLVKFVYGENIAAMVDNFEPILQRFNSLIAGKMLICVDETVRADHKQFNADFNKFKPKVTGNTTQVERKGMDISTVLNYNSYAICSNHDIPVKIEERDRRHIIVDCNNEFVGNNDYFNSLVNDCFNQETGDLFYSYVRSDIQKILVPLLPLYQTEAKTRIIDALKPSSNTFLDEVFLNGGYSIPFEMIQLDPDTNIPIVFSKDIFQLYNNWCKTTSNKCLYKENGFCKVLYKYDGISSAGRKTIKGLRSTCAFINSHYDTTLVYFDGLNDVKTLLETINILQQQKETGTPIQNWIDHKVLQLSTVDKQ